jgi:SAM-dependent methyltransferase
MFFLIPFLIYARLRHITCYTRCLGCGRAPLLARLCPEGRELHGIDIAPEALKSSRKRHPGINFYIGDIRYLPFKTDTFDYLVCIEALEHIEKDELARECFRTLKPGGTGLFTVPNGKGISGREPEHLRFFSFQGLVNFLEDAGFEVVSGRRFGLYFPLLTRISGTLATILNRDLPLSHPLDVSLPEPLATHFL